MKEKILEILNRIKIVTVNIHTDVKESGTNTDEIADEIVNLIELEKRNDKSWLKVNFVSALKEVNPIRTTLSEMTGDDRFQQYERKPDGQLQDEQYHSDLKITTCNYREQYGTLQLQFNDGTYYFFAKVEDTTKIKIVRECSYLPTEEKKKFFKEAIEELGFTEIIY